MNDAKQVADVMNSVIAEGRYTAFDRLFSEEEEKAFISSLGSRSALHIAEIDGKIVGVQSMDLFSTFADSVAHVATMGTWLRSDFRGCGIGRSLAEKSFRFARSHGYRKVVIQKPETSHDNFVRDFGERFVPGYKAVSAVDLLMIAPFDE